MRAIHYLLPRLLLILMSLAAHATPTDPWCTGPVLAQAARNMPKGAADVQTFYFDNRINAYYNRRGQLESVPDFRGQNYFMLLFYDIESRYFDIIQSL